jgi:hypothetical protein
MAQISGKKRYKAGGKKTELVMGTTLGNSFNKGRTSAENRNPNMIIKASNSIEKMAKLTEKRLSIKLSYGSI